MNLDASDGLLDGKYEVQRRLATGGMGDVYLVRHRHLQEQRVVKVLRSDLATDSVAGERFQQEARIATQIKHPHVAILYDYSQMPDGRYYMVWEYIDGWDIGTRIREEGPMPAKLAVELGIQALKGLDAVHSAGVIHRDISPDNIMLTKDRRGRQLVKIIDLGLVKDLRPGQGMELTQVGTFMGKFRYCSPEQAGYLKDGDLDHRSDLYSLAQVLYEMLTGLPPFDSESEHGFVLKRLTEDPLPLLERNPEIPLPPPLGPIIMRGLRLDRDQRYSDAAAFIEALEGVVGQLGARPPEPLSPSAPTMAMPIEQPVPPAPRPARPDTQPVAVAGSAPVADPPTAAPATPPPKMPPRPVPGRSRGGGVGTELTKEERLDLLSQIDKASSRRVDESKQVQRAEQALKDGRFEEARKIITGLEGASRPPAGLDRLKERLEDAEGIAKRRHQVMQAEQMLEKYLLERQQTLAKLALAALLDLYPNHPKRDDYIAWVDLLADEASQQKLAEETFAAGRAAITRGDMVAARQALERVEKIDLSGQLAGTLMTELNEAESGQRQQQQAEELKARFYEHLEAGTLDEAERELQALGGLDVSRVAIEMYRGQLDETRARLVLDATVGQFETAYGGAVAGGDWFGAREVAAEMEKALPDSTRPQQMYAEIGRLQAIEQKKKGVSDGLDAFNRFLTTGQLDQAELALKVLKQMAADDPKVDAAAARLDQQRRGS